MKEINVGRYHLTAKVDDEDYERFKGLRFFVGRKDGKPIPQAVVNGKIRNLAGLVLGLPPKYGVHYKSGNYFNCRKNNLESVEQRKKRIKRTKIKAKMVSKSTARSDTLPLTDPQYHHVRRQPGCALWSWRLTIKGKTYEKPGYGTARDAAIAYNKEATRLLGDEAKLNVIPGTEQATFIPKEDLDPKNFPDTKDAPVRKKKLRGSKYPYECKHCKEKFPTQQDVIEHQMIPSWMVLGNKVTAIWGNKNRMGEMAYTPKCQGTAMIISDGVSQRVDADSIALLDEDAVRANILVREKQIKALRNLLS